MTTYQVLIVPAHEVRPDDLPLIEVVPGLLIQVGRPMLEYPPLRSVPTHPDAVSIVDAVPEPELVL